MLNFNTIPAVYDESFSFMEMLAKCLYIAQNHEDRLDTVEGKIETIEDWRKVIDNWIENFENNFATTEYVDDKVAAEAVIRKNADDAIWASLTPATNSITTLIENMERVIERLNETGSGTRFYEIGVYDSETELGYQFTAGTDSVAFSLPEEQYGEFNFADIIINFTSGGTTYEKRIVAKKDGETYEDNGFTITVDNTNDSVAVNLGAIATAVNKVSVVLYNGATTEAEKEQKALEWFDALDVNSDGTLDSSDSAQILKIYAQWQAYRSQNAIENTRDNGYNWYQNIFKTESMRSYTRTEWDTLCELYGTGPVPDSSAAASILKFYSLAQAGKYTKDAAGFRAFKNNGSK